MKLFAIAIAAALCLPAFGTPNLTTDAQPFHDDAARGAKCIAVAGQVCGDYWEDQFAADPWYDQDVNDFAVRYTLADHDNGDGTITGTVSWLASLSGASHVLTLHTEGHDLALPQVFTDTPFTVLLGANIERELWTGWWREGVEVYNYSMYSDVSRNPDGRAYNWTYAATPVPEPRTLGLLGVALLALGIRKKRVVKAQPGYMFKGSYTSDVGVM